MTDIIEELLEEFPELKEDKEKLSKVLSYLEKSKPNIEISLEFKEELRNRLDSIIEMKKGTKKRWFSIAIPALAFCVLAFGILVFYEDLSKFDSPNEKILNRDIMDENTMDEDVTFDTIVPTGRVDGVEIELGENTSLGGTIEEEIIITEDSADYGTNKQVETLESVSVGGADIMYDDAASISSEADMEAEVMDVMNMIDELFEGLGVESTGSGNTTIYEDFCKTNSGIIVNTNTGKTCRTNGKECREEDYIGGNCEFVPIN